MGSNKLMKCLFKKDENKIVLTNSKRSMFILPALLGGIIYLYEYDFLCKVLYILAIELLWFIIKVIKYKTIELNDDGYFNMNGKRLSVKKLSVEIFFSINPYVVVEDDMETLHVSSASIGIKFNKKLYKYCEGNFVKSILKLRKLNSNTEVFYKYNNANIYGIDNLVVAIAKNIKKDIEILCLKVNKKNEMKKYYQIYKDEFMNIAQELNISDMDKDIISHTFDYTEKA